MAKCKVHKRVTYNGQRMIILLQTSTAEVQQAVISVTRLCCTMVHQRYGSRVTVTQVVALHNGKKRYGRGVTVT